VYKADFDEERRDRERVHGVIDDMKKKEAQLEGRAAHERAAYKQTLDDVQQDLLYTKEQLHERNEQLREQNEQLLKHKTLLADTEKLNKIRVQEAQKYKDEADAASGEASKYFQEAESFRESANYWRSQVETNKREVQAKASQVKQYAKEIDRLKTKVSAYYHTIEWLACVNVEFGKTTYGEIILQ
jgi:DNA repair exonuclease SbcCD ATPase subunit